MILNGLETTKDCKNQIILYLFSVFKILEFVRFLFLVLFLDEHVMVLQYCVRS